MNGDRAREADERLLVSPRAVEHGSLPVPDAASRPASVHRPSAGYGRALAERLRSIGGQEGRAGISGALSTEAARGVGFLFLPVSMGAGALAYFTAAETPSMWSVGAGAIASAVLALLARGRPVALALLVAVCTFLAGMLAADVETRRSHILVTGSAVATAVTGRVVRVENREDGRVRLTLDVLETARPSLRYPPPRVRLTAREVPRGTVPGDVLNGYARLMPPSGPVRPGGYDFAFESWFDGIGAVGFFLGNPERVQWNVALTPMERVAVWVENARLAIAERVRSRIDGAEGEIAAALIAGVRAGIPEEINEALRRTGLAHVLSISGLHMALVALTVMVAVRSGFALFPDFASRHATKKYGASLALLVSAVYLAISGAEVAAQRSFIMLAVMLLALLFDRAALTMRNLAIAALVVIAISPHEVVGPSFQMSFGATAALIGGYAAWSQYREGRPKRPYKPPGLIGGLVGKTGYFLAGLAMTSILAGLATTIYGVYHFHRVSPHSLTANLLAMPVVSVLVMPWAVLATVLMPFGLDWLPLAVMGKGIALMNAIAIWLSERSPVDAVGLIPSASVVVFTLVLITATLSTTSLRVAAIPLAVLGFVLISNRTLPDVLVSEDARLVAVRLEDGRLAVNRRRPNGFTIQNWMMAAAASDWLRPRTGTETGTPPDEAASPAGFACGPKGCAVLARNGMLVVHTADRATAEANCGTADLIVIDDATIPDPCTPGSGTAVLTKRDLSRRGSAAITFEAGGGPGRPTDLIEQAISEPFRPWHEHRRYSREARGLPPPQRRGETPPSESE